MKKLCINTLPPTYYGGILSMMSAVYNVAQEKYDTTLCYYNLKNTGKGFFGRFISRYKQLGIEEQSFNGMKGIAVDSLFGAFGHLTYKDPKKKWKETLDQFDLFFCVAGSAHPGMPLLKYKKPYAIWIATPYLDDRVDRVKDYSFFQKLIEKITLPIAIKQEKRILRKAKKVLALSNYTRDKLEVYYRINAENMVVVPYPIKTDVFKPDNSDKKDKIIRVIFTGRYNDKRKNISLLISAFKKALEHEKNLELLLVGEKPGDMVLALMEDEQLKHKIRCIERLEKDELIKACQQSDIFALPSYQEGLCISALEAMSCGLPIISTRCGGPEQYVKNGENGFLVDNDNLPQFTEALIQLVSNDEMRRKFSKNARNHIEQLYSFKIIQEKFLNVLQDLENK